MNFQTAKRTKKCTIAVINESHDLVRLYVERELELYLSYLVGLIQDTGRTHARSALQQHGLRPVALEELAHLIRQLPSIVEPDGVHVHRLREIKSAGQCYCPLFSRQH
jgi:hypothetical protein